MTRNGPSVRRGDTVLVTAVAAGSTYADAARKAGVSERTVKRRMSGVAFRHRVNEVQVSTVEISVRKLAGLSTDAINTLADLMRVDQPARVRLGAARAILETALRWQELADVQRRIEKLESAIVGSR